jgi:acetyltransferase-like isoleucine patch superfamily enzyme
MFGKYVFYCYKAPLFIIRELSNLVCTMIYRVALKECGKNFHVEFGAKISRPWNVSIADNVFIGRGVVITSEVPDSVMNICDSVEIGSGTFIDYSGNLSLQKNAFISAGVVIYSHSHGLNPRSIPVVYPKDIGENVWIGRGAFLGHRVGIVGADSVVGANAVVTKDLPSGVIAVGNPAITKNIES